MLLIMGKKYPVSAINNKYPFGQLIIKKYPVSAINNGEVSS